MKRFPTQDALADALVEAGSAHHDYESRFLDGVRDEAWPGWYAAYVLGRLGDFAPPTELAEWLRDAPSKGDWAEEAAAYVLAELEEG